ncbi:hypothetical protein SO802_028527 [Lithocarpus litseifolius]|uniref:Phytocyanin domain-containing protein n=1 Tax=Lithocarpus litseifolius TaxID=425828 RepID=A0AAW2BS04_9ROSI
MGFTIAQGLMLVLLIASTMAVSTAWPFGNSNNTKTSNRIIVGGSNDWKYGFDYTKWAIEYGPFYLNDTLVFKYDPPTNKTFPHNVYLLPNLKSFITCNFTNAQKVANETQGAGEGFEFVLERAWHPHYFACGVGAHCLNGTMRYRQCYEF